MGVGDESEVALSWEQNSVRYPPTSLFSLCKYSRSQYMPEAQTSSFVSNSSSLFYQRNPLPETLNLAWTYQYPLILLQLKRWELFSNETSINVGESPSLFYLVRIAHCHR